MTVSSGHTRPGRNEPCHCGSGKKYKKCCLAADEEAARQSRTSVATEDDEEHGEGEDEGFEDDWEDGEGGDEGFEDDWEDGEEDAEGGDGAWAEELCSWCDAPVRTYPRPPAIPKASPEACAIVDAWLQRFMPLYGAMDLDAMHALLDEFLAAHPDLVPHLHLHDECLLEWEAAMCRAGRWDELIDRLRRLRRDFPLVYDQVFQYLDNTLATALLASGRPDELSTVLDRFAAYPDADPDHLSKLFDVLLAANREEDVFALARATAVPCACSSEVLGYGPGLHWLLCRAAIPVLEQRSATDAAAEAFVRAYDALELPWPHGTTLTEAKETLDAAFGPVDWSDLGAARARPDKANRICSHFLVWLHETQGMCWPTATFFADRMRDLYADKTLGKRALRHPLGLADKAVEAFLCRTYRESFSMEGTRACAFLQALWLHADFLVAMGVCQAGATEALRGTCRRLHAKLLKVLEATDAGPHLFARFPEYGFAGR
jgi:hypothetical protein